MTGFGSPTAESKQVNGGQPLPTNWADSASRKDLDAERASRHASTLLPPPSDPMAVSRCLVKDRFTAAHTPLIRSWRGGFRRWDGRSWPELDEATVKSELYGY